MATIVSGAENPGMVPRHSWAIPEIFVPLPQLKCEVRRCRVYPKNVSRQSRVISKKNWVIFGQFSSKILHFSKLPKTRRISTYLDTASTTIYVSSSKYCFSKVMTRNVIGYLSCTDHSLYFSSRAVALFQWSSIIFYSSVMHTRYTVLGKIRFYSEYPHPRVPRDEQKQTL